VDEISIVADSTADLPEEIVREFDIEIVRNLIILDGKSLQDGKDISREEYYTRLPNMNPPPTTATASSGIYQQSYESLFRRGAKQILSIHPPLNLSGIINAATIASKAFGNRVQIFDSGQVSLGSGFQILAAAEAIRKGANLETVLRMLTSMRKRARIIAILDTLEYVRRSGRVSWARARIGNLLQIKPFIELKEGAVTSLGECRTRGKGFQRLMEFLYQSGNLERLAILHTNAEEDALRFQSELSFDLPNPPLIVNVTTVIGTHVGPNGLGFVAVVK
jgi:DegV family protein with EDD domain